MSLVTGYEMWGTATFDEHEPDEGLRLAIIEVLVENNVDPASYPHRLPPAAVDAVYVQAITRAAKGRTPNTYFWVRNGRSAGQKDFYLHPDTREPLEISVPWTFLQSRGITLMDHLDRLYEFEALRLGPECSDGTVHWYWNGTLARGDGQLSAADACKVVAAEVELAAARQRSADEGRQRARDAAISRADAVLGGDVVVEDGRGRAISVDVRRAVWERDGGACVQCGSRLDLEFDHVIPFALGGANTVENLQVLCLACNRMKGATV